MKRLKVLFALLAVVFASASAFKSHSAYSLSLYSYAGGTITNASNWNRTTIDPGCSDATGTVCVIQAISNGLHPNQTDLNTLSANSNTFQKQYSNPTNGFVEVHF